MNSRTILFVSDSLSHGGKERRMLELMKGLLQKGYTIILIVISDLIDYEYVYQMPIRLIIIKRKYKFEYSAYRKITDVIKTYNPSTVHSWGFVSSVYLGPIVKFLNVHFVNGIITDSVRNLTIRNKYYLMSKFSFVFSDVILANSQAGIKSYRAPAHKTKCIYNGIDLERFTGLGDKNILAKELLGSNIKGEYYVVGMVAAFEDRKDYDSLIEAAVKVCNRQKNIYFILVGGGRLQCSIQEKIPLESRNNIVLTGRRNDVESIINIFDVGVLLTNSNVHGEGISNSILEYMALSKPVIATRGGGTDEVVYDAENGYLIDPFSIEQLVERIFELISKPDLRRRLGSNGRKLINENFSLSKMTESMIKVYEER